MKWKLVHQDLTATSESRIMSRTYLILEDGGTKIKLGELDKQEEHALGAKRVLVDAANLLKRLANEMEKKADKLY